MINTRDEKFLTINPLRNVSQRILHKLVINNLIGWHSLFFPKYIIFDTISVEATYGNVITFVKSKTEKITPWSQ